MPNGEPDLILRAKTLIDGRGGSPVSPGAVAIAGRKIVYAGPAGDAPPGPAARVVDLPEACLLPGLIDMHVHPTYYWEEPDVALYNYEPEASVIYTEVTIALLAAAKLRESLLAGVTTVRDTGSVNQIMFDVQRAVNKGLIPGSKVYVAGRLVVPTGGHVHYLAGLASEADGPYGFRRAVREEIRAGADFIKLANNGADLTQEELDAAVDEAHRLGKKVACHTSQPPSQRMAIEAGVDTFEHGTPSPEEIDRAVEKGIAWTPTLNIGQEHLRWCRQGLAGEVTTRGMQVSHAQFEREYDQTMRYQERKRASVARAVQAGLRLAAGTDSWMGGVRFAAIADEVCWLVDYGVPSMQALQAATAWPAAAMGWHDIGTLAPDKLADVVAVDGDPLADPRALNKVSLVVREGQVVQPAGY